MCAHVRVHVSLLRETFATDAARVWFLFGMHRTHMSAKVAFLRETLATSLACMILGIRMNLDVSVHVTLLCETLATHLERGENEEK